MIYNSITSDIYSSTWRCEARLEEDIEYYELRFTNQNIVEGWLKENDSSTTIKMFKADFVVDKSLLEVSNGDESFTAARIENQIVAVIDDNIMIFSKITS